jgi:carboxylesterase
MDTHLVSSRLDPDHVRIQRGAEPFLLDGGEVGCVCTHGFTASPEEMRWLATYLHDRGLTVYVPRLAGHGTQPAIMRRQHWLNWYEDELDAIALLRARCRRVFAVGLSMGGLLSLRAGEDGLVDGVIALAAPVFIEQRAARFARLIDFVRPYTRKGDWPGALDEAVRAAQRALGLDDYGRLDYGIRPTASVVQLSALMRDVRRRLSQLTAPLLLVYSRADDTAPYANLDYIVRHVRSADVVQHTLERSGHVLTQDVERETVYRLVWEFLQPRLG